VERLKSDVAGDGLFIKVAVKKGQQVFAALLPDVETPFWFEGVGGVKYGPWYRCSIEAMHDIDEGVELMIKYAHAPAEWDM